MLTKYCKNYNLDSDHLFIFDKSINCNVLEHIKSCNVNIKHLILDCKCISFEEFVSALSYIEDVICGNIQSINLYNCNQKLLLELLDFYNGYGFLFNVIATEDNTPFSIIHKMFTLKEMSCYYNFGICLNFNLLPVDIWTHETIWKDIDPFVNALIFKEQYKTFIV